PPNAATASSDSGRASSRSVRAAPAAGSAHASDNRAAVHAVPATGSPNTLQKNQKLNQAVVARFASRTAPAAPAIPQRGAISASSAIIRSNSATPASAGAFVSPAPS